MALKANSLLRNTLSSPSVPRTRPSATFCRSWKAAFWFATRKEGGARATHLLQILSRNDSVSVAARLFSHVDFVLSTGVRSHAGNRASAFHQDYIAPSAVHAAQFFSCAYNTKSATLVNCNAAGILRENP